MTTSGALRQSSARATRAFCPPDRSFILMVCAWLTKPKVPSCLRAFSYGKSNSRIRYSDGVSSAVRCSPECWSNLPIRYTDTTMVDVTQGGIYIWATAEGSRSGGAGNFGKEFQNTSTKNKTNISETKWSFLFITQYAYNFVKQRKQREKGRLL